MMRNILFELYFLLIHIVREFGNTIEVSLLNFMSLTGLE